MYYANKEIETLNREYLQSIAAVFFSKKRIRLTASVLLPCVHSRLEYLSVKKSNIPVLEVRERVLLGTHMVPILP